MQKWKRLPAKTRQEFVQANRDRLIRRFTSSVVLSMEAATDMTLSSASQRDLADASRHALGPIVIEMVGSRIRRTAAIQNIDMDLQITRDPSSEQRDEPFTDIDMQKETWRIWILSPALWSSETWPSSSKWKAQLMSILCFGGRGRRSFPGFVEARTSTRTLPASTNSWSKPLQPELPSSE